MYYTSYPAQWKFHEQLTTCRMFDLITTTSHYVDGALRKIARFDWLQKKQFILYSVFSLPSVRIRKPYNTILQRMQWWKTTRNRQYYVVATFALLLNFQLNNFLMGAIAVGSCHAGDKKDARCENWELLETYPHNLLAFTQVWCGL